MESGEKVVTLPSGNTVTLRDPKDLKVKDRKKVLKNSQGQEGLMAALSIVDGLIAILVKDWTFEFPIPSVRIQTLDELSMPDYDLLASEVEKAQELIFPNLGKNEKSEADENSPFGNSND